MNLTKAERFVVSAILEKAAACMKKDGEDYFDNGNFIMCLEPHEMKALKSAIKKI